jgi:hypothetical protein
VGAARPLSPVDVKVLRSLPRDGEAGLWLTPAGIARKLELAEDVVRSCLDRLGGRDLVTHDGERPRAFARTARAELLLEHAEADL